MGATVNTDGPRDFSIPLEMPDLKNARNSIPIRGDEKGTRVYLNSLIILANRRMLFGIACIRDGEHVSMEESKKILEGLGEQGLRNITVDAIKVGYDRLKKKMAVAEDSTLRPKDGQAEEVNAPFERLTIGKRKKADGEESTSKTKPEASEGETTVDNKPIGAAKPEPSAETVVQGQ